MKSLQSGSLAAAELTADAGSRATRYLIAALVVAIYIALGLLFHLNTAAYELLGIPLVVAFQLGVQRQPLRMLWVRSKSPFRLDGWFILLWAVLSLVPVYAIVVSLKRGNLWDAAVGAVAIVGAFGLTYAQRSMRRGNVRQMVLCLLTAGGIGLLLLVATVALPGAVHLHGVPAARPTMVHLPALMSAVQLGIVNFLILWPGFFMVEEVFFRGAIDTYVHRGDKGVGWLSAVFVSALWGLWHLPAQSAAALSGPNLISTIVGLLVAQIVVGVPLSYWWRKSGNLTVTGTSHALIDAVRNALAGATLF
jgi:membrane protease YdiL (CAAX protease family)